MSDDEDLYCNPQSNVFLQARMQNKPPKKHNEKKSVFGKKPPPPPSLKESKQQVIPDSASAELGSLFKNGVTKPSELRKTVIPERNTSGETNENHVIDFRAHLRAVPSPIKTEAENRRCSITSETDVPLSPLSSLPPLPPDLEEGNKMNSEQPPIKSPPVPKRNSTLSTRRVVPTPTTTTSSSGSVISVSEQDPLSSAIAVEQVSEEFSDPTTLLPGPPPIMDNAKNNAITRPKRRLLQKPSKAPIIPINTFPVSFSMKSHTSPSQTSDSRHPEEDCEEMYTENEIPPPDEDCEELYTENEVPLPGEDCEEMYTENDIPPHPLPASLYDAPRTSPLAHPPDKAPVCPEGNQIEDEEEELYTDEVCDYPSFKQVGGLKVEEPPQLPVPQYNVDEEDEEDIYDDAEFPLTTQSCPADEYRPELEEGEDIYDDIGNYSVARVESPVPVRAQPSPMLARHSPAPPSALPPPPQLPASAPPPVAAPPTKQKQKGGLFGIFKKGKKKSVVDSVELSLDGNSVEETQPSERSADIEHSDELLTDGKFCEYSDDDDEPIYEEQ